jgi:hypothetical protein
MRLRRFIDRLSRRRRLRFGSVYARIIETLPADEHPATGPTQCVGAVGRPDCAS